MRMNQCHSAVELKLEWVLVLTVLYGVLSTCTEVVTKPSGSVVLQVETPRNFDFGCCFRSFNRQGDL
jgi:hypothetical protein